MKERGVLHICILSLYFLIPWNFSLKSTELLELSSARRGRLRDLFDQAIARSLLFTGHADRS